MKTPQTLTSPLSRLHPMLAFFAAFTLCLLSSCQSDHDVQWEEVNALDELSIACEAYSESGNMEKLNESLKGASAIITQLPSTKPKSVPKEGLVDFYLKELQAWNRDIHAKGISEEEQRKLAYSLHPIIEQLMLTANVPHIHATSSGDLENHEH